MSFKVILVTLLTIPVLILSQDEISVPAAKRLSTTSQSILACSVIKSVANCSNRGLPDVPTTLPATITVLLMDHNNLKNLTSKKFARFENLTHLDISHNIINQVDDDSFQGLTHLQCLHMEGNRVQCPDKALSVLHSLGELYLDGSPNMTFGEHFQNLTKLTSLSLSGHEGRCNITNIFNNTFEYVPYLNKLDLSLCGLNNIETGAFLTLKTIEELDISDNDNLQFKNFQSATYGLTNSSIRVLKAYAIVAKECICNILKGEHTQHLKMTKLEKLYFDHNRVEFVMSEALSNLPHTLWYISARYNSFTHTSYFTELSWIKGVTHLYLGNDDRRPFPVIPFLQKPKHENQAQCPLNTDTGCQPYRKPKPEYTSHFSGPSHYATDIKVPPHLQVLHVTCAQLDFDLTQIQVSANNITRLKLNCNLLGNWIGPVKGMEQLTYLDLSNNIARNTSTTFFRSFPKLKVLNISFNLIGSVMNMANMSHIFDGLTSLEVLDMSLNDIHGIPDNIFHDLVSVKTVNLSNNAIYLNYPLRVVHMKKLQILDLTNNEVRWFSKVLMTDLDTLAKSHNITIHLIRNPISCTCNNLDFLNWIWSSKVHFVEIGNYTCAFGNKTFSSMGAFKDVITTLQKECSNNLTLILGSVFGGILALVIVSGATAYRYRWNLRYWYYAARLRLRSELLVDEEGDSFTFSAFVSHADEDEDFVVNEMINRLETEDSGLNLNIHHRDFIPGQEIASNILSAIQGSKKTVVVLSRHFLESYWCMYELQMANMESIKTGRDVLIIIMFEDISTRKIPKEVLYHLKTDSYITYPHNRDEGQIDLFWRRLIIAIKNT
ncbi:toll-like receptor 4 [Gigantopelta aegis]|uniref:toll-like receptor 4 n=1 Tax=Gigantopelta aegis TaxID=1735272 RepID=UPI001B88C2A4|nr:toll-like receptor 4 [Gigantopelta aegis]